MVHCLFEQSGTFKNEFIKLGMNALDYDIQNEFGQTDIICDLFEEIRKAYGGGQSIFDEMSQDDLIMAFFPCTRFEDQSLLLFRCDQFRLIDKPDIEKLKLSLGYHEELSVLYELVTKLAIVCLERGLKVVIENPYSTQHYLTNYWCLKPSVIDKDRTINGDYYKKPTQYWFLNIEPKHNFVFEPIEYVKLHTISNYAKDKENKIDGNSIKTSRSMIHPQYASRFIKQYLIDYETDAKQFFGFNPYQE